MELALVTDAGSENLGAVIEGRPMAYTSRMLNQIERNYSNSERELLNIDVGDQKLPLLPLRKAISDFQNY